MKRINIIKKYIENRSVLDIGCIDHSWKFYEKEDWLHGEIKKVTKKLTGLDYLREDIDILNKKGFNIKYGNAENFDIGEKFEIIVAAEIIEHLSNPGSFLECAKNHLEVDGLLLLTTPNVFSLGNIFRIIKLAFGNEPTDNNEHVAWYNYQTLAVLSARHGFKIEHYRTFYPDRYNSIWDKMPWKSAKSKIFIVLSLNKNQG